MTHFVSKKTSDCGRTSVQQAFIPKPPDGGWGWLVVFGSFMIHVLADGVTYSFGIFFTEFIEEFKSGKGVTSWIGSILVGVTYGSGPLASGLTNRYGCRVVTIIGGVIAAGGCVLSYFANSVYFLMFSFGGVTGLGFGLIYLPAIVSVTMYFEKKRAFATGVAVCGSGVGTFIMAPVIKFLVDRYEWRGAMLIVGALTLNNCLFGALFRPLDVVKEPYVDLDVEDAVEEETEDYGGDEAEETSAGAPKSPNGLDSQDREFIADDEVMPVVLLRHIHGSDTAAASMPLIIGGRSGDSETHGAARRTRSRDSATSRLALRCNLLYRPLQKPSELLRELSGVSAGAASLASVGPGVKSTIDRDANRNNITTFSADMFNISSYTKSDTHLAVPLTPTKSTDAVRNFDSHHSLLFGRSHNLLSPGRSARRSSSGGSPRRCFRHPRYILDRHPDINLDLIFSDGIGGGKKKIERRTYLAPFSRHDAFFQGSILDLEEYKSAPKLYDVNVLNIRPTSPTVLNRRPLSSDADYDTDLAARAKALSFGSNRNMRAVGANAELELMATSNGSAFQQKQESLKFKWWQKLPEIMRQMLDLSLLKDPIYLLFAISNFLTSIGFNAPYTFLPDRVDKQYAALIVMIIGVANTIGRVVLGILSDKKWVNRLYLYNSALALCGIFTALSVCSSHFYWLATYAALFGASMGCYVSLTSVILVDLLSLEKLTNAFGLLLLFQGIASLIGSPLVGWIYDATKSYEIPFILLGVVISLSGIMLFVIPLIKYRRQSAQPLHPNDEWSVDDVGKHFPAVVADGVAAPTLQPSTAALTDAAVGASAGQPRRKRNVSFADNNCITNTITHTKVEDIAMVDRV